MPYKQVKPFDQSKGGKKPGYCLQNTRLGYGIAPKYDNAAQAWKSTEQHKDRNVPQGVDVPLYYDYGSEDHVNVRLANGKVWSDGNLYASIEDYEAKKAPRFLGWGESVNGVRVIEYVPDPPKPQAAGPTAFRVKPGHTFRVYDPGTTNVQGSIDHSWGWYEIRGVDAKYPNRWLIHSAKYGKPCAFPFANTAGQSYLNELETQ